tara:strand:- start:175 stop:324 length:150 start_codon:yes stop_codon:yes gene_type:complete
MSQKEIDRKVAIILATDVINYSKHMEKNEAETVQNHRILIPYAHDPVEA